MIVYLVVIVIVIFLVIEIGSYVIGIIIVGIVIIVKGRFFYEKVRLVSFIVEIICFKGIFFYCEI